jgi:hypothetical protein
MNYLLALLLLGVCGGAYYLHTQDETQISDLTQEVSVDRDKLKAANIDPDASAATITTAARPVAPSAPASMTNIQPQYTAPSTLTHTAGPAPVQVVQPDSSSAIDSAANAAMAATNGNNIGTVTTLDHRIYTNCKVLKVEPDGVTFSHDDGITKVMYPMMPPDLQKRFGYTPQQAVAQTEAEIRATEQAQAATNAATNP